MHSVMFKNHIPISGYWLGDEIVWDKKDYKETPAKKGERSGRIADTATLQIIIS